jgi:hypothetical protein
MDDTETGTSAAVDDAWRRHRQWSLAADATRTRVEQRRRLALTLLVVGAVAGAVAAQDSWPRTVTGIAAGLASFALFAAGFVQQRYLGATQVARWPTARAASETLKAQVVRYLVGVAPFDGSDRDQKLNDQVDQVQERAAKSLAALKDFQAQQPDGRELPAIRDFDGYRTERARKQAEWHRGKIREHEDRAARIRRAEAGATVVGALLAAVAAGTGTGALAVWIGVASTIAASFAAHRAATNHERITASYAMTTDVLDRLLARLPMQPDAATQARFVTEVEARLAAQNDTWLELFPTTP